jgi:hypothetical protein
MLATHQRENQREISDDIPTCTQPRASTRWRGRLSIIGERKRERERVLQANTGIGCSRRGPRTVFEKQAFERLEVNSLRHITPKTLALLGPLGCVQFNAKVHVDAELLIILPNAQHTSDYTTLCGARFVLEQRTHSVLQEAVLVAVIALKDVFRHLGDQLWRPAGGRHRAPVARSRPAVYR